MIELCLGEREALFLSLWALASGELTGKHSYLCDWASWLISSDWRFGVFRFLGSTVVPAVSN